MNKRQQWYNTKGCYEQYKQLDSKEFGKVNFLSE